MQAISPSKTKVAICGVGFVGRTLARLVHKQGWHLVAAYNRAGAKIGQDIGRLADLGEYLGILVEDIETADVANSGADIVLIAAANTLAGNMPAYEKFLSAGINVLCHSSEAYSPRWTNKPLAEKIDRLAKQHEVTFTGGGIWDMTRLWAGMIVAGPCVEIESFLHSSTTEIVRQGAQFLAYFGVGKTVVEFEKMFAAGVGPLNFYHIPGVFVLEKMGYAVTGHKAWVEPIVWDEPVYCPELERELTPGTVLGARIRVDVNSAQGVTVRNEIDYRVFKPGEIEEMRWRVNGKPGMEIRVVREDSGLASAASLFNRIPDVVAARAGIVELLEMSPAIASVNRP